MATVSNYNSNQSSLKSFRSNGGNKHESNNNSNGAKERKLLIEEVSVMRMIVEGVM